LAQMAMELDGVALIGELSGGQVQGREVSERQERRGRRKGKGREPSPAPDKGHLAWAAAVTGACALSAVSVVTTR
jgi:hypothetical protein